VLACEPPVARPEERIDVPDVMDPPLTDSEEVLTLTLGIFAETIFVEMVGVFALIVLLVVGVWPAAVGAFTGRLGVLEPAAFGV